MRDKSSEGAVIGIPNKERSYKDYLMLLRHEVDQHARQSLNGTLMFGFGGGALKIDDEVWYEGLAKFNDINFAKANFGDGSSPPLPYYTFAIKLAEEGKDFVEVFKTIRDMRMQAGQSEEMANKNSWNQAYRVFRGHSDTSNPDGFAMPKDQAYLRGWMLQSQLAGQGLSYLNECAISKVDGLNTLAEFDFAKDDLLLPDLNLAQKYLHEVALPKAQQKMAEEG